MNKAIPFVANKALPYSCRMNTISSAIAAVGGLVRLASVLGVKPPTVSQWANGHRPVPVQHCVAIERATAGAVTRRDLRPDDWHLIWPELVESEPNPPAAPAHQAPAAINPEAQGAAHA